jgi:hypothetical protein
LEEAQTKQSQAITGMPCDVPVPSKVTFTTSTLPVLTD